MNACGKSLGFILAAYLAVYDPLFPGKDRRLGSIGEVKLAQDIAHVAFHCVLADDQLLGDAGVIHALGDQTENFNLARG
jgi:hypothetical protein